MEQTIFKDDKLNIEVYEDRVRVYKGIYNDALQRLEDISNGIHLNRKKDLLGPRGEGVGAEVLSTKPDEYLVYSGRSEISENYASPDNLSSISTTSTVPIGSAAVHNTRRMSTLGSTTPIVDGLLKAVSSNYSIYRSQPDERLKTTIPNQLISQKQSYGVYLNHPNIASTDLLNSKGDCLN